MFLSTSTYGSFSPVRECVCVCVRVRDCIPSAARARTQRQTERPWGSCEGGGVVRCSRGRKPRRAKNTDRGASERETDEEGRRGEEERQTAKRCLIEETTSLLHHVDEYLHIYIYIYIPIASSCRRISAYSNCFIMTTNPSLHSYIPRPHLSPSIHLTSLHHNPTPPSPPIHHNFPCPLLLSLSRAHTLPPSYSPIRSPLYMRRNRGGDCLCLGVRG
jgi:hypothetical protein